MKQILKTLTIVSLLCLFSLSSFAGKGTLYGNEAGTKFCCSSGSNDCSAAACKKASDNEN